MYVISFNDEWFHLHYLAVYCILITLVKYPADDHKSSQNMFVINHM